MDCAEAGRRVCSAITKSQCHRKGLFHDEPAKRCFIQISPIYLTKATSGAYRAATQHRLISPERVNPAQCKVDVVLYCAWLRVSRGSSHAASSPSEEDLGSGSS